MTPRQLAAAENDMALRYCYKDRAADFPGRWGHSVEKAERHIEKLEAIRDGLRALDEMEGLRRELERAQAGAGAKPDRRQRRSARAKAAVDVSWDQPALFEAMP